jgi:hypothetical protein
METGVIESLMNATLTALAQYLPSDRPAGSTSLFSMTSLLPSGCVIVLVIATVVVPSALSVLVSVVTSFGCSTWRRSMGTSSGRVLGSLFMDAISTAVRSHREKDTMARIPDVPILHMVLSLQKVDAMPTYAESEG